MKKIKIFTVRIMLLSILIQLSSCQKFIDRIFPGHTGNDYTGCRINHIIGPLFTDDGIEEVIATVEYNEANNPISLTYNREAAYLLYLHYMFYDSLNRLQGYRVYFNEGDEVRPEVRPVYDHRYGYSGDRIVTDTSAGGLTGYMKILSTFEYDSKGRIVVENRKIIEFEGDPETWEDLEPYIYNYNSNDNKIHGDDAYDNKVNFRRTNKVWMFLTRDYSMNNLVGAVQYNEQDLPVRFENSKDYLFNTGLSSIDYDCQ